MSRRRDRKRQECTDRIVAALSDAGEAGMYGLDLWHAVGRSSWLYPALWGLESQGFVRAWFVGGPPPRRRRYALSREADS